MPTPGHAAGPTATPGAEAPLVIAIDGNYPPFSIIGPGNRPAGLLVEIWRAWSEATGTPIQFRSGTWEQTLADVRGGRADIHSGLFETPDRAQWLVFSDPIQKIPTAIFTLAGNARISSLDQLAGHRVGAIRGSYQAGLVNERSAVLSPVLFESNRTLVEALLQNSIDALVSEVQGVDAELARLGLAGALDRSRDVVSTDFVRAAALRANGALIARIDEGFRRIPVAHLADIERRWLPDPTTRLFETSMLNPEFSATERAWLRDHPVLRLAVTDFIRPIDIVGADGTYSGLNADLIAQLSAVLGIQIVPEFFHAWGDVVDAAKNGKVDAAFSVSKTAERARTLRFTRPYAFDPVVVVTRGDQGDIRAWEDLAGRTVGFVEGASMSDEVRAAVGSGTLRAFADEGSALRALADGEIDAHVSWLIPYGNAQRTNPVPGLKIVVTRNTESGSLRIAVPTDRDPLSEILDKALTMIPRETWAELRDRWLAPPDAGTAGLNLSPVEAAWLRDHPKITIAMMEDWPPLAFAGPDGAPTGLSADLVRLLNARLGGVLDIVTGPWSRIYEDGKERRIDAILDITPRDDRAPFFEFTTPYLTIPHVIIAARDTAFLATETDLRGKTVALEKGFGNVNYFKNDFPDVTIREYADTHAALDAVARGEADAYAGNRAVAMYIVDTELMGNLGVHGRLRKDPTKLAIGVRKDAPMLRDILEKALNAIDAVERRNLQRRWTTGATADRGKASLSERESTWIEGKGVVRVANELDWPPFDFAVNGEPKGFSIDLVREVAKRTGLTIEFVNGVTWSELYAKFEKGEIDVLPAVYRTPERAGTMAFTQSYTANPTVLVTHKGATALNTLADLAGKRVAIVADFATADTLAERHPDIKRVPVKNVLEGLKAVSLETVDAFIGSLGVISYVSDENVIPNLRIAGEVRLGDRGETMLHMGVSKENTVLRDILQRGLDAISKDEKNAVRRRWLPFADVAEAGTDRIRLTGEEQDFLSAHPTLALGIDPNWPPFEFRDKNGEYSGISSGFVAAVSKVLGVEMRPVGELTWTQVMEGVRNGKIDVVPMIAPTAERETTMVFTRPYVSFPGVIITRSDSHYIGEVKDLAGKRIGVVENYVVHEALRRDHPDLDLTTGPDVASILADLSAGKLDAVVANLAAASYVIDSLRLTNLKIAAPTEYSYDLAMAVPKRLAPLAGILDKALDTLSDAERTAIKNRWIAVRYDFGLDLGTILIWALPIGGGLIVVIVGIVVWNRRLNREIRERIRTERRLQFTQNAVDKAVDAIFWIRPEDGGFDYVNEAATRMLGYARDELIALHVFDLDPTMSREAFAELDRVLADGASRTFETRLHASDGRMVDVEITLYHTSFEDSGVIVGNVEDVTERKRAEEATRAEEEMRAHVAEVERFNRVAVDRERRIVELKAEVNALAATLGREEPYNSATDTHAAGAPATPVDMEAPEDASAPEEVSFADLIDLERFQQLFEHFCDTIGIASAIIDLDGKVLAAARWQRACTQFHRQNEKTCARCIESDTDLALRLHEGEEYSIYRCRNGLTDCASPVVIDGRHVANVFIGQFLLNEPDLEFFATQARAVGFDEAAYLEAIREIPIVEEERLPGILGFLTNFARLAASQSMERHRAKKAEAAARRRAGEIQREREAAMSLAEDAIEARAEIGRYQQHLEELVAERTEDLREAEERNRMILEAAAEGVFGLDVQGRTEFVNRAACDMLGFEPEELLGHSMHDLVHHAYPDGSVYPRAACHMYATVTRGEAHTVSDEVLWRKDGTCFAVEYSSAPITKDGATVGAVITFRDISELTELNQKFTTMLDNTSDFIYFKDRQHRFVAASRPVAQLIGVDDWRELRGRDDFDLFPEEQAAAFREQDRKILEGTQPVLDFEEEFVKKDGTKGWLDTNKYPLRDIHGRIVGICGLSRDITERKQAEQVLRDKMAELETFHRLAVGREMRMIALKEEVNRLRAELGLPPQYEIVE